MSTIFRRCLTCPAVTWLYLDSTHVTTTAKNMITWNQFKAKPTIRRWQDCMGGSAAENSLCGGMFYPGTCYLSQNWFWLTGHCIAGNLDDTSLCFKCLTLFTMRSAILWSGWKPSAGVPCMIPSRRSMSPRYRPCFERSPRTTRRPHRPTCQRSVVLSNDRKLPLSNSSIP